MSREDTQKVRAWLVSKYVNIGSDEIDALLAELEARGMAAEPKVIDRILRRRFPESFSKESSMSTSTRVVPPREKPQAAAPPPQTPQELEAVMKAYVATNHWQTVAPNSAPPWAFNGDLMFVGSRTNLALLKAKLKEMGVQRIRVTDIQEAVFALVEANVFARTPQVQVVEKPVEAPKPSERELHNRQVRIERALNDRSTSPIRGAKESAKPLIKPTTNSNLAEAAASEKAERENAIVNEALSRINTFTGHTHGRTASGRAALRETFQIAMDQGLSAKEVLAAVETKASELAGNSSIR